MGLTRVATVAQALGLHGASLPRSSRSAAPTARARPWRTLEALLRALRGRASALFTSPHFVRYNERIQVDGAEVGDAELIAAFERIEAARGATTLTFFEYNTLAALQRVRRRAGWTSRCWKSGSAAVSTPPTSSTPTSPCSPRSASITAIGWATRSS